MEQRKGREGGKEENEWKKGLERRETGKKNSRRKKRTEIVELRKGTEGRKDENNLVDRLGCNVDRNNSRTAV